MHNKYYILLLLHFFLLVMGSTLHASVRRYDTEFVLGEGSYEKFYTVPLATFTADPEECTLKVFFTSLDTTPGLSHYWDFGNGQYSTKPSPYHIYLVSGEYKVRHTVVSIGGVDTEEMWVTAGQGVPFGKALFEALVQHADAGASTWFYSYNNEGEHTWDFGDGSTGVGSKVGHFYGQPGTYTVTHTVQTDFCTFSKSQPIIVYPEAVTVGETGVVTTIATAVADSILPEGEAVGMHIYIKGTLKLEASTASYKFRKCNIRMGPGARIVVDSGAWMNIGQVSSLYGNDRMWRGIEVLPGGMLRLSERVIIEDAQYALYMHPGSHLSSIGNFFNRNYISIYVPPSQNAEPQELHLETPLWGNRIFCSRPLAAEFAGQTYEPGHPLQGEESFAGMYFNNLQSIEIGNSYPYTYSYFDHLANGLVVNGCETVQVANCLFERMERNDWYGDESGYGIRGTGSGTSLLYQRGVGVNHTAAPFEAGNANLATFKDCSNGIFVSEMGVDIAENRMMNIAETAIRIEDAIFSPVRLFDNQVQALETGIILRNCYSNPVFDLQHNYVEVGESGIGVDGIFLEQVSGNSAMLSTVSNNQVRLFYCPYPSGTLNGIHLQLCDRIAVLNNFIRLEEPAGPTTQEITGIKLVESSQLNVSCNEVEAFQLIGYLNRGIWTIGGSNIQMRCNTTDKTGYGFQFHNLNQQVDFSGNFMVRHFYGLHIGPYSQLTSPSAQSIHEHRGNEWWSNPYNAYEPNLMGALHEGNAQNVLLSRFSVYPDYQIVSNQTVMDPEPWGTPNVSSWNAVDWFSVPASPPAVVDGCNQNCSPGISFSPDPELSQLELFIARDEPLWAPCQEGLRWDARRQLLDRLTANLHLIEPYTVVDSFYQTFRKTNMPFFNEVEKGLRSLYILSSEDSLLFLANYNRQLSLLNQRSRNLKKVGEAGGKETTLLQRERVAIEKEMRMLNRKVRERWLELKSSRLQQIKGLLALNGTILPQADGEANQQLVNAVRLRALLAESPVLDPELRSKLSGLCRVIPGIGGRSVYEARAFLRSQEIGRSNKGWGGELPVVCEEAVDEIAHSVGNSASSIRYAIFPNPVRRGGQLVIKPVTGEYAAPVLATLYNEAGQAVQARMIPAGATAFVFEVTSVVSPGNYYLQISRPGQTLWGENLIIFP